MFFHCTCSHSVFSFDSYRVLLYWFQSQNESLCAFYYPIVNNWSQQRTHTVCEFQISQCDKPHTLTHIRHTHCETEPSDKFCSIWIFRLLASYVGTWTMAVIIIYSIDFAIVYYTVLKSLATVVESTGKSVGWFLNKMWNVNYNVVKQNRKKQENNSILFPSTIHKSNIHFKSTHTIIRRTHTCSLHTDCSRYRVASCERNEGNYN